MSDNYDPDNPKHSYVETISWLNKRIIEIEKNCERSFAKVEDHIKRILAVIDVQAQSTELLTDQINELRGN